MNNISFREYLAPCCTIAQEAGLLIMGYFTGSYETKHKLDKSPVTDADIAANRHITAALRKMAAHIPIIAEEDETLDFTQHPTFWLVDPLDGTRSFVRGEGEFTVNIGLIHQRRPVLGIIYAPVQKIMYFGEVGQGAFREVQGKAREQIHTRDAASDGVVVVRSRSHPSTSSTAFLDTLTIKQMIPGSSSIKFCQVAEGSADIYPRFGRTMEWDTAAGHAILAAAGGRVETVDGKPLLYGKPEFENPPFIAYGK